jgi:hypothetical protein
MVKFSRGSILIESISVNKLGRFLLVQLHIQALVRMVTLKKLRESLENLPDRLNDRYDEAVERIQAQGRDRAELAKILLYWITSAFEPLTVEAIQHAILALELDPNQPSIDVTDVPQADILVTVCAGLVVIDEESKIIRLVHHTAQEYFDRHRDIFYPAAQATLARACILYLQIPAFAEGPCSTKAQFDARNARYGFFVYAARHWGNHARGVPEEKLAGPILSLLSNDSTLASVVQGASTSADTFQYGDQAFLRKIPALAVAAGFGLLTIVRLMLQQGSEGATALHKVAWTDHLELVELLIQHNADVEALATVTGIKQTALHGAAIRGYVTIARRLLGPGVDPDIVDQNGRTALHHAAQNGKEEATRALLEYGADMAVVDRVEETASRKLTGRNYAAIIDILSERWENTIAATQNNCRILSFASRHNNYRIFRRVMLELQGKGHMRRIGG